MWIENIFGAPVWGWILLGVLGIGFIVLCLWHRRSRKEPIEEHMDYFCCCYARGEISKEDFEELKKDLNTYVQVNDKNKEYSCQCLEEYN